MKLRLSVILTSALLGAFLFPGSAGAATPSVGVTGWTTWGNEFYQTMDMLRDAYGLPVHDGCSGDTVCVHVSHYRAQDGQGAVAEWGGDTDPKIKLNDYYDAGALHRRTIFAHEFGHVLGLDHSGCDSSMNPEVPVCGVGRYVIGYSGQEQQKLHERWG